MRSETRPTPNLYDDVPSSQGNTVIEAARKAIEVMRSLGSHSGLINGVKRRVLEEGGLPTEAPPPTVQAPTPQLTKLVYGDGNIVREGDIVQDERQMLAEVTVVAGNGVVLKVPAVGAKVVQLSDLLKYKRMGGKK